MRSTKWMHAVIVLVGLVIVLVACRQVQPRPPTVDRPAEPPEVLAVEAPGLGSGGLAAQAVEEGGYRHVATWGQRLSFGSPEGVAVDASGNMYVADAGHDLILKFDSSGVLQTYWGSPGVGDGQFHRPSGVAVDASGNVYVADTNNHRIQKFDPSGTFLTRWGSLGTGVAEFVSPLGVAVDASGNVYVTDNGNHRVLKFDPSGTYLVQWGSEGGEDGEFRFPNGVAVDASGNVYVTDTGNRRIQKFDDSGAFKTRWGSPGTGEGQFSLPSGVAVDASGNVYVVDRDRHRIQKFDSTGAYLTEWGTLSAGEGPFDTPRGLAVDTNGYVYVADSSNYRVQKFDAEGALQTNWGSRGLGDGEFESPHGVAVDANGNVYVVDALNDRIHKFDADGAYLIQWGSLGAGDGEFYTPRGVAVDASGNVFVADTELHRIQKFDAGGAYLTQWGSSGSGDGRFLFPYGVAVDASGNVYVADTAQGRIQKFDSTGTYLTQWGAGEGHFGSPQGVAVDAGGHVYVADTGNHRIQKFDADGTFLTQWGSNGSADGQFDSPSGVAVDANGRVYVADTRNHRIQKFEGDGTYLTQWGSLGLGAGQFRFPRGVAVGANGRVYVADSENHRIQKFAPVVTDPPIITPTVTGTRGLDDWFTSDVTVTWVVVSDGMPLLSTTGCDPVTLTEDTPKGPMTLTCEATNAGGTSSESVAIKRDATPPRVTAAADRDPNEEGWYRAPVIVGFYPSGLLDRDVTCDAPVELTDEGADGSATGTCTDQAGNVGTATLAGIRIDLTPPDTAVTGVTEGGVYPFDSAPAPGCSSTDGLSGVRIEATLAVTGGTDGVGELTATCSGAEDGAGNVGADASVGYTVLPPNRPPTADAGGPYAVDEGSSIVLDASGSSDPDGDALTFAWDLDDDGTFETPGVAPSYAASDGPATPTVRVEACDPAGLCDSATAVVTVANVAPTVDAGPDQTVYRHAPVRLSGSFTDPAGASDEPYGWSWSTSDRGSAAYGDALPGSTRFALEGTYPVTLVVTDADGAASQDELLVEVLNRAPVCTDVVPRPDVLWPPDRALVEIALAGATDAEGDALTYVVTGIRQDEPVDPAANDATDVDGEGVGTSTAWVRAERSNGRGQTGNGRVYTIAFTVDDGHGGSCTGTAHVGVPKTKKGTAVDDGPAYDSTVP